MLTLAQVTQAAARGMRWALRRGVMVLEPQDGPWVHQNLWGDQRMAPLPVADGQVVQVLGKNTIMYGPPAVHSIQLGRSDAVAAGNADVRARITLGCGGAQNSFDCDWLHGAQFAAVCNSVDVSAVSYAPNGQDPYVASEASVALSVFVAKGTATQGCNPLTYTEPRILLTSDEGGVSSVDYTVPDFAREVCVHVRNNDNAATVSPIAFDFELLSPADLQILGGYNAQVCAGGRRVPIPGGTNVLSVGVPSTGSGTVIVQWFLGL